MSTVKVHTATLDNGLIVIGEQNPHSKSCGLGFFVRTGSRDETPVESGISHFLEHMMFKGTAKRSAMDLTMELGNLAVKANAFTSEENTVYYGTVLPEYFPQYQELLSDMLRPVFDPNEFDTEKKVILEEIALYQDRPQFYLFEHALRDYFADHPAGNSVLGSTESVSAISREQMQDYFDRRYSPSNITLVASGNFDWDQFVSDAERYCCTWRDFKASRKLTPHSLKPITKEYTKENITRAHVVLLCNGPSAQDDQQRFALSLLSIILGDSVGSRLDWELVDKGLVENAGCEVDEKDGTGCVYAYASMDPDKIEEVVSIMRGILDQRQVFTDSELEQARTKLASRVVLGGELPMGRLMGLGMEWNYRREIHNLEQTKQKILNIDRAAIESALEKYPLDDWSEFRLLPG